MGRILNAGQGSLLAVPLISAVFLSTVVRVSPLNGQVEEATFRVPSCGGCVWVKGNTHTHTLESDGDSDPEVVARWYKEHGYDFLVISDHNVLYHPGRLAHLVDSTFLLVPGEEVTSSFQDKPVHLNGLNLLTRGHRIYGIAVDDAHHFQGEFSRDRANPGRGFVVVQVSRLDAGSIMAALEEGRFYASTGVELENVVVEPPHRVLEESLV